MNFSNDLNRRGFLKWSLGGAAAFTGLGLLKSPLFKSQVWAQTCPVQSAKKLVLIFLRGGNDGINTVIPAGDPEYSPTNRPTLFIDPLTQALDLGNGFAYLHPALDPLLELFNSGDLAICHRIGYTGQSRSHFSSQQFWENASPGDLVSEEGWVNRLLGSDPSLAGHPMAGASLSSQTQLAFRGEELLAHVTNLADYNFGETDADLKLLGSRPQNGDFGSGLLGVFSRPATSAPYDQVARETGLTLSSNIDHLVCRGVDPDSYLPHGGATYPDSANPEGFPGSSFTFFRRVKEAALLLKETDVRAVGIETSGFDLHSSQGGVNGAHATRLREVAHALRSLSRDLQDPAADVWADTAVLVVTEFGRTSKENGSVGTDHGEASVMLAAGGSVAGDIYNCDPSTWQAGDMLGVNDRYLPHLTDFRAIYADLVQNHFGLDPSTIIPGYSTLAGPTYNQLGIF